MDEFMVTYTYEQGEVQEENGVRFSFDTKDDDALESADMLDAVAESYGIYFTKSVRNNRAEMILTPFYSDIGLAGVKERDPYPPISFFYE